MSFLPPFSHTLFTYLDHNLPPLAVFVQCDLASEGFLGNVNQLDEYCKDKNFHAWFETSAKENVGIDEAARCLVAKVTM